MAKIIQLKRDDKTLPIYGECGCGSDKFLLQLSDESDNPDVVAFECCGCREVVEFEPQTVIECVFE